MLPEEKLVVITLGLGVIATVAWFGMSWLRRRFSNRGRDLPTESNIPDAYPGPDDEPRP